MVVWGLAAACHAPAVASAPSAVPAPGSLGPLQVKRIPESVLTYARALASVRDAGGRSSIEAVYALARTAIDSLQLGSVSGSDLENPLDRMDDSTFVAVQRATPGLTLSHEQGWTWAARDLAFFAALAQEKGDSADVAFFRASTVTHDAGDWPVYSEQLTDESGCTRFGTGSLVRSYATWAAFRARYPRRYARWAAAELGEIEDEFTRGDCVCADRAAVVHELRLFVKQFPSARIAASVRARIRRITSGKIAIRERCRPG